MNENRKASKVQSILGRIEKKFAAMNKGSKLLVRIASVFLLASLSVTLLLVLSDITNFISFHNQTQIIQWMVLYSVRTWALMFTGALILDYLVSSPSK